jgi:hypothetical protein
MFGWFKRKRGPEATFLALRDMALAINPEELEIPRRIYPKVFALLMEMGYPHGSATLAVIGDGTTSLYFSAGGGIIGGGAQEPVREASERLLKLAQETPASAAPETETPLPEPGQVRFVFLTDEGRRAAEAQEAELGGGRHELSSLFFAAHDVITELRKLSP